LAQIRRVNTAEFEEIKAFGVRRELAFELFRAEM
jgi:hypothetical protein